WPGAASPPRTSPARDLIGLAVSPPSPLDDRRNSDARKPETSVNTGWLANRDAGRLTLRNIGAAAGCGFSDEEQSKAVPTKSSYTSSSRASRYIVWVWVRRGGLIGAVVAAWLCDCW